MNTARHMVFCKSHKLDYRLILCRINISRSLSLMYTYSLNNYSSNQIKITIYCALQPSNQYTQMTMILHNQYQSCQIITYYTSLYIQIVSEHSNAKLQKISRALNYWKTRHVVQLAVESRLTEPLRIE